MEKVLNTIATMVNSVLPKGYGFFVLVFNFDSQDARANYVSNGKREDVINCMKEFLIKCGHEEDWMKDIK